ncbi:hypothetical protein NXC14_CH01168 [Rhizobium sp. NXC14]|nr:hypothetical protein NXC14_CH01168 [Rhizobium sp. NXC14]
MAAGGLVRQWRNSLFQCLFSERKTGGLSVFRGEMPPFTICFKGRPQLCAAAG